MTTKRVDAMEQSARERRGDKAERAGAEKPFERRRASGCLWDACEALLGAGGDPKALARALDSLQLAFDCAGVAIHAVGPDGELQPLCARGEWRTAPGDLRECLGAPLSRGGERVGALDLQGRKHQRWSPDQVALVRTATGALGAALGARLELERLRLQPGRDSITGLADGQAFRERLFEELARVRRGGLAMSIVTLDVDHFAALNARYGREAGNHVLIEFALVLKVAVRDTDVLARLAGDQFAVLLPECDAGPARRLAERLRRTLEEHRFARVGRLSVSAGVASSPRDGTDALELMGGADAALDIAKKAGRRRTASLPSGHTH